MSRFLPFCLLLAGLFGSPRSGRAQAMPLYIDLKAEKLDVPAGPWQVTRVLDLRADRSRLGPVRLGLDNHVVSANFAQPMAAELLQAIQTQAPARAEARPVLMRVFALALSEDVRASSEAAEAELIADFLEPLPDSMFRVLLPVGAATRRAGLEVTKHHATNLAQVLQEGLRQLAALPAAPPNAEVLTRADALAGRGGATSRRFPIQLAALPQRGFYRSLQEFQNNAPSEPKYPFAIEHIAHTGKRWAGTDEVQAFYLRTDARNPRVPVSRHDIWGLSDGREALIVHKSRFYKLLPTADGRNFTFIGPPLFDEQAATNMAVAAVAGGAIGAAIAGAAQGGGTMIPYELHLASGRVLPMPEAGHTDADGFQTVPDTARVYVYRRVESAKNRSATLSITGQKPLMLQAGQWTKLIWTDRRQELALCGQVAGEPKGCHQFVPDFSQPNYLECMVPEDGSAPTFRLVPVKEGQFELRRIQRLSKAGR
ncbi:hypothetical protein Q5H92_24480 [Hymenobacter sp. M29]|uniref:Uncharacterized protein n=1 Tax=Hymenobacter mellowenesis TaxID=3063995 RepID=A0ABT9AJJ0_9BACT|nr:hypothetical protein [Hymenobacter sp. M29]MDO7849542.1 hypothetical protein [Hymenobacter sp. M29]